MHISKRGSCSSSNTFPISRKTLSPQYLLRKSPCCSAIDSLSATGVLPTWMTYFRLKSHPLRPEQNDGSQMFFSSMLLFLTILACIRNSLNLVTNGLIDNKSGSDNDLRRTVSKPLRVPMGSRFHYNDVIMSTMASQINSLTIDYSSVYSGADQRKHKSSASLAFVLGIHRSPVNSLHKAPVTRKMFLFDDVIMSHAYTHH